LSEGRILERKCDVFPESETLNGFARRRELLNLALRCEIASSLKGDVATSECIKPILEKVYLALSKHNLVSAEKALKEALECL